MKIKSDLRKKVEALAYECKPQEAGGYLIKNNRDVISDFLPVPNIHPEPRTHFQPHNAAKYLAYQYAKTKGRSSYSNRVEAFFHSHPEPCIMSAADLSYADYNKDLIFITITPTGEMWKRNYIWYACRGIVPEKIEFV
jgi:proteasome lid subunit RPN8/RPN11